MSKSYTQSKPLISIHVPKTGGSSVREQLKVWYADHFFHHYVDEHIKSDPKKYSLIDGMCIHGHFNRFRGYGVDDYYPNVDQYITFIRDPFEQHVSLYFYLRREAGQYKFNGNLTQTNILNSFENFMSYLTENRNNIQTTYANTFFAHIPQHLAGCSPTTLINDGFVHIGITELLDYSIILLASKLNKEPCIISRQNISPRSTPINKSFLEIHKELFAEEHRFYNELRSLHLDELSSNGIY